MPLNQGLLNSCMITIYHNNRCSKSRCALKYLTEKGIDFTIINYLETPPTELEIEEILKKLHIPAKDLIRKGEKVWKENYAKKDFSEKELIKILSENPILIQRPIIIHGKKATIARPLENIFDVLK